LRAESAEVVAGCEDRIKVLKKHSERQKEEKDRLKKRLKEEQEAKAKIESEIEQFRLLQKTLEAEKRRHEERVAKLNEQKLSVQTQQDDALAGLLDLKGVYDKSTQ
jgi:chromosome segregation ATPase